MPEEGKYKDLVPEGPQFRSAADFRRNRNPNNSHSRNRRRRLRLLQLRSLRNSSLPSLSRSRSRSRSRKIILRRIRPTSVKRTILDVIPYRGGLNYGMASKTKIGW